MRRRQRERGPRVLLYEDGGPGRLMQPSARGYDRVLELTAEMVELVDEDTPR
jgi:hypothetical protein